MSFRSLLLLSLVILLVLVSTLAFQLQVEASPDSYYPSGYALGGSTSWLSGDVSNLTSDDGVYMTFRNYYSGTDTSDFVDNRTSDVDSSADKGIHSDFSAQQAGPDSITDTLTEENTGVSSNTTLIDAESFEGTWPPTGWTETGYWNKESNQAYDGTYSADFDGDDNSGDLDTPSLNCSGASAIYVSFWFMDDRLDDDDFLLQYWNGSNWNPIQDMNGYMEGTWNYWEQKVTDSQHLINGFRIRFSAQSVAPGERIYVDVVTVKKETINENYELDLEIEWTSVDYDETNEQLCIYVGNTGSEDLLVDYWTGSAWSNLLTDLIANSWNNVSVSLTSTAFSIRFKGGTETNDTTQDNWDIDVTLLHFWSDEYTLDVEFRGSSSTEDWSQLNWTVSSAWTIGSVNVTLQLYNYTLGGYSITQDGYIAYTSSATPNTDETKSQTVTTNPANFRDGSGNWKMKIKGVKSTTSQFDFKADLVKYACSQVTPESFDWNPLLLFLIPIILGIMVFSVAGTYRKKRENGQGFEFFNEMTGGGIPDSYSVMIVGGASSGKSVLCQQLTYNYLTQGKPHIYVTYDVFPSEVRKNMKNFQWDVSPYELEGSFKFIDAFSSTASLNSEEEYHVKQPFALSNVGITISSAMDAMKHKSTRVFLDSTAPLFARVDASAVIEFLQDRSARIKGDNGAFFFTVGKGTLPSGLMNRLEEIVDCIIELDVYKEKGKTWKRMRIRKQRGRRVADVWIPFKIELNKGITFFPLKDWSET